MLQICSSGTKLYLDQCLEETFWNDIRYSVYDPKIISIIGLLLILSLWLIFFKSYAFKKEVKLWKRIIAFILLSTASMTVLLVVILFGQIMGMTLL